VGALVTSFRPEPNLERKLKPETKAFLVETAGEVARMGNHYAGHPIMPSSQGQPIVVETDGDRVLVVNTDYGAAITEFGSAAKNTPARAPLRRGVGAAGLRFRDTGKQ
jgi:hypothetical protein